ncbi:hypothetical protein [Nocardia sp. NPDC051832]|uniref:hypothetical protein n=1 Tax=Nocardia sp. NPDC051832 TaxID=3155673 RepID=UPI0034424780
MTETRSKLTVIRSSAILASLLALFAAALVAVGGGLAQAVPSFDIPTGSSSVGQQGGQGNSREGVEKGDSAKRGSSKSDSSKSDSAKGDSATSDSAKSDSLRSDSSKSDSSKSDAGKSQSADQSKRSTEDTTSAREGDDADDDE